MLSFCSNFTDDDYDDYYCLRRRKKGIGCIVGFFFLLLVIIIISTMVGLHYTKGKSYANDGQDYNPTETRLIPFSNLFCQSLTLKTKYNDSDAYNISLSILKRDPILAESNVILITSISKSHQLISYYIHSGSMVNVSACYNSERRYSLRFRFDIWRKSDSYVDGRSFPNCKYGASTFSYFFEEEDWYTLKFSTNTYCNGFCDLYWNLNMSLYLTNYNLYNNTALSSCSISTDQQESTCSVSVPRYTSYALLTVSADFPQINNNDKVPLETKCVPRVWVYFVCSFLSALVSLAFCFCCAILCCSVKKKKCKKCTVCCLPYIPLLIMISVLLGIRFHTMSHFFMNHGSYSSPTESRLIPVSNSLCQSVNLKSSYNGFEEYNATLYLLSSKPNTSYDQENFTISEVIETEIKHYYLYYLNSGSKITINACFVNEHSIVPETWLYIAKGIEGYNGGHRLSDIKARAEILIGYNCSHASTLNYDIYDDNFYYFIFFTSTRGYVPVLHLNVTMSFQLTLYNLENSSITGSCSLSVPSHESECSVGVPLHAKSYAVLSVTPNSSDVNRLDKIPLNIRCSPRLLVFFFPPFLFFILLIIVILAFKFRKIALLICKGEISFSYIKLAPPNKSEEITNKFTESWSKGTVPEVLAVFAICNRWQKVIRFFRHGTEEYYHGTKLQCDILNSRKLCKNENCSICSIARYGFDKDKIRTSGFQRFGPGFYLAPNSSKANDYVKGTSDCRAILFCYVYPGKKYEVSVNNQNLNGPPRGCKSIYGKAGASLNYDEIVIPSSKSKAIHPRYIIVYKKVNN